MNSHRDCPTFSSRYISLRRSAVAAGKRIRQADPSIIADADRSTAEQFRIKFLDVCHVGRVIVRKRGVEANLPYPRKPKVSFIALPSTIREVERTSAERE